MYINIHPKFDGKIKISYTKTEEVEEVRQIEHTRARAVLEEMGIEKGIEIGSMADIPSRGTGLGSSSSYTVGLLNGLASFKNEPISTFELAEKACDIEINKLKEPIGKQDQYAVAFGGLNLITFRTDGKIDIEPIYLSPQLKEDFKNHLFLFYTGIQRSATPILAKQKENINQKFSLLREMSDLVLVFLSALEKGDFKRIGELLDQAWQIKKRLSSGVSSPQIDEAYTLVHKVGAWGAKILGAGGGGFFLVLAQPKVHSTVQRILKNYQLTPFEFSEAGTKIVFKSQP